MDTISSNFKRELNYITTVLKTNSGLKEEFLEILGAIEHVLSASCVALHLSNQENPVTLYSNKAEAANEVFHSSIKALLIEKNESFKKIENLEFNSTVSSHPLYLNGNPIGFVLFYFEEVPQISTANKKVFFQLIKQLNYRIELVIKEDPSCLTSVDNALASIELANPFFIQVDYQGKITNYGKKINTAIDWIQKDAQFVSERIEFAAPFNFNQWLQSSQKITSRLQFFLHGENQKFKFSAQKFEHCILLICLPVINAEYPISNYGLKLNDFGYHDYISEFLFLQKTIDRTLADSQALVSSISQKNVDLIKAKEEVESLAKFPEENPNPILRIDFNNNIIYKNKAVDDSFVEFLSVHENQIREDLILSKIEKGKKSKDKRYHGIIEKNNQFFSLAVSIVEDSGYINLYCRDISDFINEINKQNAELNKVYVELDKQKSFYEFILNNLPADIAIFDLNHKYLFINPKGIKNKEIREFMIGKDDFDYCRYRNIPTEKAEIRRELFNNIIKTKKFVTWEDEFNTANGERQVVMRSMGPMFDENGKINYVVGYGTDITTKKIAEEQLTEKSHFQDILTDISSSLIDLQESDYERTIFSAIERIGSFFNVDRVFVYKIADNAGNFKLTFEWISEKNLSLRDDYGVIKPSDFNKSFIKLSKGQMIIEKNYTFSNNKKVKSMMRVPLMNNNDFIGFIGFDAVFEEKDFSNDEKSLLSIFAQMLVNLENKFSYVKKIQNYQEELLDINTNLEKLVDEKTASNNTLTQSLHKQDKLALIGEISAGIAHDLNTPLGVVKIGIENTLFSYNKILEIVGHGIDPKLINRALKFSKSNTESLPLSGLQLMRERNKWMEKIETIPNNFEKDFNKLSLINALIDNKISIDDDRLIQRLFKLPNLNAFLQLAYHFRSINYFIETIQSANQRSADVVKSLKNYFRASEDELKEITVDESLRTVVQIFGHEIKHKVKLSYNVDSKLKVMGYEARMFQLWSNLIKNAIEASIEGEELKIVGKKLKDKILVSITNSGDPIPNELKKKIFEKFFSTKKAKEGTGLGLSIVKNVVTEHRGKIAVDSKNGLTTFTVTLPDSKKFDKIK